MSAHIAQNSPWFLKLYAKPAPRLRIFCFHHGGGGALTFRRWQEYLPPSVEVVGVQLPGRETRFAEPLVSNLSTIVEGLKRVIVPYLDIPYVFFGNSVGALIGHCLLDALADDGAAPPAHLIVAGRAAPSDENLYYDKISQLPDSEFLKRLQDYEGTPEEFIANQELTRIYLPILKADFSVSETPAPRNRPLSCPITAFGGENDRMPHEKLKLWGKETTAECDVRMFPGGHFFVRDSEALVVSTVREILTRRHADLGIARTA